MHLTKQKQLALIKLGAATAAALFMLWFLLIRPAQLRTAEKLAVADDLSQKIAAKKAVIHRAEQINAQLKDNRQELTAIEDQMVNGDIYLWIEKILREFEIPQQLEFTKYDPPQIVETDVLPRVPYKTASFVVNGNATYHDLGTFLANFENSYPHIRIRRFEIEPAAFGPAKDEKLSFLMEMQVFIKSGGKPRS